MGGRVRELKAIGKCSVELVGNEIKIIPTKGNKGVIGAQLLYSPDPKLAIHGGFVLLKFRKTPSELQINSLKGSPIQFKRKNHPVKVAIPKRTVGFDPRSIEISVSWRVNDGNPMIFQPETEVNNDGIRPVLLNYGRGMRTDGMPQFITHTLNFNGSEYVPLEFLRNATTLSLREYDDGSIHIDKMGVYSYYRPKSTSILEPFLSFDKVEVETRVGVERGSDGLPYSHLDFDGKKYVDVNPSVLCTEIISLCSNFHINKKLNEEDFAQLKLNVEYLVEIQDQNGLWSHPFPTIQQGIQIQEGWFSSIIQGFAASALVRASIILEDKSLIKVAEKAIRGLLEYPSLSHTVFDARIFQEYTCDIPLCSLNGHLSAIMGIADLVEIKPTKEWKRILRDAILDTETITPLYDLLNISAYDLSHLWLDQPPSAAKPQYHATHVANLHWLAMKTESEKLAATAERWESYFTTLPHSKNK